MYLVRNSLVFYFNTSNNRTPDNGFYIGNNLWMTQYANIIMCMRQICLYYNILMAIKENITFAF